MAELSLRIKADFDQAQASFRKIAEEAQAAGMTIKEFTKKFEEKHVDNFIAKQQQAGAAIMAVRGDLAAMTTQQAAYGREIERLIKSGLDPESEAIKRLQSEYVALAKNIENEIAVRRIQENAWKVALGGLAALAAGVGAFVGASIKSAAATEDWTAAFTPMMGSTERATELVKRLNQEAVTTPFELNSISASVKRLLPAFGGDMEKAVETFRMIGDTAAGNAQFLETMTNAYSKVKMVGKATMKELNMIAGAGVPIYAELAKNQNKSVQEIMEMVRAGEITAGVLESTYNQMTSEGGLFFKGMETAAFTFNAMILGVQENISLIAGQIGEKFLPVAKDMVDYIWNTTRAFSEWLDEGDNLEFFLDTLTYAVSGATAGLTAFLVVAKGHAVLDVLKRSFDALTGAMAKNPIGALAVVVSTLAVPAFIALGKAISAAKIDEIGKNFRETKENADGLVSELEKMNPQKAIDAETTKRLIGLYPELNGQLEAYVSTNEEATRAIKERTEAEADNASKAQIRAWQEIQREIRTTQAAIEQFKFSPEGAFADVSQFYADLTKLEERSRMGVLEINATLATIGKEFKDGKAVDIPVKIETNAERVSREKKELEAALAADMGRSLSERLSEINLTANQQQAENIKSFSDFLAKRAEMEKAAGGNEITYLENQRKAFAQQANLSAKERAAAEIAINDTIKNIRENASAEEAKRLKEESEQIKKGLQERLLAMGQTEAQAELERKELFGQFLSSRLEAEKLDGEARIVFLQEQQALLLAQFEEGSAEYLAAKKASDALIEETDKELADKRINIKQAELRAISSFFGAMSGLIETFGKENRAALVLAKTLGIAQVAMNTAIAISEAIKQFGPPPSPLGIAGIAAAAAIGATSTAQIISTKIPSAETGGRFIVPDTSPRVDGAYMRVNANEQVDITPAGQSGYDSGGQTFNLVFDGQVLATAINRLARAGELNTLQLAANL